MTPENSLSVSNIEGTSKVVPPSEALGDVQSDHLVEQEQAQGEVPQQGWLRRNMLKASAGAFALSTTVSIAAGSGEEIKEGALESAPWIATGLATSEAMFIGGAAVMLASAGKKIGNPLKIRSRWQEIRDNTYRGPIFRAGLHVNTIGAVGTAGTIAAGAATSLPPETWPAAFGLAAVDLAATAALRAPLYQGIREVKKKDSRKEGETHEAAKTPELKVREATLDDIDRLADIDLLLFKRAYGNKPPEKEGVVDMLTKRLENNPGWMLLAEVNGEIEGFVSAFRTNKPIEEFVSWEDSTADGTLEGRVDPDGKYGYVTNMTIKHEAVELGAEEMLLANLVAKGIEEGVEYAYFVSRMPHFKRWADEQIKFGAIDSVDEGNVQELAEKYFNLRNDDNKRYDPQLRMYESFGYKLEKLVGNAFEDDASYDFGVVCKAQISPNEAVRRIKPIRKAAAFALKQVAKRPKLIRRLF
jgi:hypothetical protein